MKRVGVSLVLMVLLAAVAGIAHARTQPAATQPSPAGNRPNGLALGPAGANPSMTASRAVDVAAREFGSGLLAYPVTTRYGSFADQNYVRRSGLDARAVGRRDVWKVAASGVSLSRPCGNTSLGVAQSCPVSQHLVVVVDDKAGAYLEAVAY